MKVIFSLCLLFLPLIFSCGVKGPPKTPPSKNPEPVKDIYIKQQGNRIVVYWFYNPVYDDGKPIKEKFFFLVEENGVQIKNIKVKSIDNLYWFEKIINNFNNELCYRIIVKTLKGNYSISRYKCIIPHTIDIEKPNYKLRIVNNGILIVVKNFKKKYTVNVYKGNEKDLIPPVEYASVKKKQFLDKKVKINSLYCYYLTYKYKADESNPSKTTCILYKDIFPPAPPENPEYIFYKKSLFLIWKESPSADVVYYEIKKGNKVIGLSESYFYQVEKWKKGDVFSIYAVDKAGNRSSPVYLKVE